MGVLANWLTLLDHAAARMSYVEFSMDVLANLLTLLNHGVAPMTVHGLTFRRSAWLLCFLYLTIETL